MKTSTELNLIAEALSKAQGEFQNPEKNRSVTVTPRDHTKRSYSFSYATLDQILEITRPILSKHGLSVVQVVEKDDGLTLTSRLLHGSGQWIESNLPLRVEGDGVQALGSAISYLRRYGIISLLGLAAEEDDDGNRSDGNQAQGQDRQPRQSYQQQRQQEERRDSPKVGQSVGTSQATPTKPTPPVNTPAGSVTTDARPEVLDPNQPKTCCEAWFRNLSKLIGEKCAGALWKHTASEWQLRFDTLKDVHLACEHIRKVMGEKTGADMINSTTANFSWDDDGVQLIRQELVRASLGEVTSANGKG